MSNGFLHVLMVVTLTVPGGVASGEDWPMYGRDGTRNAVSPEGNAPTDWEIKFPDTVDSSDRNVKWKAALGQSSFGSPVVAGGLVCVCTNNEGKRDPAYTKDAGCLLCFDERDGTFLWQHLSPRFGNRVHDWPYNSVASPPMVEGDRLWFMTNRWEVICLDIGPLLKRTGQPKELWKLDMPKDLGVFGHCPSMALNLRCAIGASYKGMIYVITGNGVDDTHRNVPAPDAPALLCLDKGTGRVVWKDNSPGKNILCDQVSSPLVIESAGTAQVVAPQGDGWIRSFDALTGKLLWAFDANPKGSVYPTTRNEIMAAPVLYEGRVYIGMGQSAEHGEGPGLLRCIDPTKQGDVSEELDDGPAPQPEQNFRGDVGLPRKGKPNPNSAVVWKFERGETPPGQKKKARDRMNRTGCSVAAAGGLVFAPDFSGFLHCLDARTGQQLWVHDMVAATFGSPLVCDGKVYAADENGHVSVFALSRDKQVLAERDFDQAIYCSPVFANGVLYVTTRSTLYAIRQASKAADAAAGGGADAAPKPVPPPPSATETQSARRARDAIFVPTPQDVVEKMLEVAAVTKDDVVYDLGCGDGRIVVTAAKRYGCKATGFDTDPECVRLSRGSAAKEKVGALVTVEDKDLFTVDLSGASVVTLYLGREVNRRLLPQLAKLKPGARVVSHNFEIEGWAPDKLVRFVSSEDDTEHVLYLWTAPLQQTTGN